MYITLIGASLLGIVSLTLSAVFSGMETAFYRVSKLRLKLDAIAGDRTAKRFLWFANNPSFFIATLLVGNNMTTYAASVSMVLFVGIIFSNTGGFYAELAATLILTPIFFVWGEMFPKYIALNLPNKILRLFSPVVMVFCWIFLPLTIVLWSINRMIAAVFHKSKDAISLSLGRREMLGVLAEGKNTGLLSDAQRRMAEGIFNCSNQFITHYAMPQSQLPTVTTAMKPKDVLQAVFDCTNPDSAALSLRHSAYHLALPVYEPDAVLENGTLRLDTMPIGYVQTIDLEIAVRNQLSEQFRQLISLMQTELPIRSIAELSSNHSVLTGLILLQTMQNSFGCVVDEHRRCLGFVSDDHLRDILLTT